MNDLVDTKEAGLLLGINPRTLLDWRTKKLTSKPPFYRVGKNIRYSRAELRAWLLAQKSPMFNNYEEMK
jgi:DNA-binding transcriptional MerR regulator